MGTNGLRLGLWSLSLWMLLSSANSGDTLWGCIDPWNIGMGWPFNPFGQFFDPASCLKACSGSYMYGVLRGTRCYCGWSSSMMSSVDRSYCHLPCNNGNSVCGGNFGSSVFCKNDSNCHHLSPIQPDPTIHRVSPDEALCQYAGCANDPSPTPINPKFGDYFPDLNPTDCINFCFTRNHSYANLLYIFVNSNPPQPYCSCRDVALEIPSEDCTHTCPYQQEYSCGNLGISSVYCTTIKVGDLTCMSIEEFHQHHGDEERHDCLNYPTTVGPSTDNAREITTGITVESTIESTTQSTAECTTGNCRESSSESITESTIGLTKESTTENTTGSTTGGTTENTSKSTRQSTTVSTSDWASLSAESTLASTSETTSETATDPATASSTLESDMTQTYSEAAITKAVMSSTILTDDCTVGNCESDECSFENNCYAMRQIGTKGDDIQVSAFEQCRGIHPNAKLVAIESQGEQDFLAKAFVQYAVELSFPPLLTSGYIKADPYKDNMVWRFWGDGVNDPPMEEYATFHFESDGPPAFLFLIKNDSVTLGYFDWVFKRSTESEYFICEYTPNNMTSATTTPSSIMGSTTTVPITTPAALVCEGTDLHGSIWAGQSGETVVRGCPYEAEGQATWKCECNESIEPLSCQFQSELPDYRHCSSYWLIDVNNQISDEDSATTILNHISSSTSQGAYFGHEIQPILDAVEGSLDLHAKQSSNLSTTDRFTSQDGVTEQSLDVLNDLLDQIIPWRELDQNNRTSSGLRIVDVSENVGFRLVDTIVNDSEYYNYDKPRNRLVMGVRVWHLDERDLNLKFPLKPNGSWLEITKSSLEEVVTTNQLRSVALQLTGNLEYLFPASHNEFNFSHVQINSPILSVSMNKAGKVQWSQANGSVMLVFEHVLKASFPFTRNLRRNLHPGEKPTAVIHAAVCGYFETSEKDSLWNNSGCRVVSTNSTHTVCSCKHLTSFADLMDVHDYIGQTLGLEVTTIVCSSLSVLCFIATFITYGVLKIPNNERSIVTLNLCFCLLLSHLLVLTVLDKTYFYLPDAACASMGVVLHYVLLCSFSWMAVEGIYLYRLVVAVFKGSRNLMPFFYLFGYGMPFIVVAITITVATIKEKGGILNVYNPGEMCWLRPGDYTWAFSGPVSGFLIVNAIFLVFALRSASFLQVNKMKSIKNKLKNWIKGSLSLASILGIGWLSGYLLMVDTDLFAYIFTIVNGLQGCFIFLFHCVMNDKVRLAFRKAKGKTSQDSFAIRNNADFQSSVKAKPKVSRREQPPSHSEVPPLPFLVKARGSASSQESQFTGSSFNIRSENSESKAVLRSVSGSMSTGSDSDASVSIPRFGYQRKSTRKRSMGFEDVFFARSPEFGEGIFEPTPLSSSDSSRLSFSSGGSPVRRLRGVFDFNSGRNGTTGKFRGLDPLHESPANLY